MVNPLSRGGGPMIAGAAQPKQTFALPTVCLARQHAKLGIAVRLEFFQNMLKDLREWHQDLVTLRNAEAAKLGIFFCALCQENIVDAENGFDTCEGCQKLI